MIVYAPGQIPDNLKTFIGDTMAGRSPSWVGADVATVLAHVADILQNIILGPDECVCVVDGTQRWRKRNRFNSQS